MKKWILKNDILELIKGKRFESEKEFEEYITPLLVELFEIKPSQIGNQITTTSFDYTLSNCADIVVRTDDEFKKVILVIELKLTKSIDRFENGDYEKAAKQLHKYCQDTRSPYGILLTDENCFIFKYRFFRYDDRPERNAKNRIPNVNKIEDEMARDVFLDFLLYKKSLKYFYLFLAGCIVLGLIIRSVIIFVWNLVF